MPKEFIECVDSGGKVRTVSGPNKEHGLGKGEYVKYCYKDDKSYRGEIKIKKAKLSINEIKEICPNCAEKMEKKGMTKLALNEEDIDKALAKGFISKDAAKGLRLAVKRKGQERREKKVATEDRSIDDNEDMMESTGHPPKLVSEEGNRLYERILDYLIMADDPSFNVIVGFRNKIERLDYPEDKAELKKEFEKEFGGDHTKGTTAWDYYKERDSGYYRERDGKKVEGMAIPIGADTYGITIGTQFLLKGDIGEELYQKLAGLAGRKDSVNVQRGKGFIRIDGIELAPEDFAGSSVYYRLATYLSGIVGGSELGYKVDAEKLKVEGFRGKSIFGLKVAQEKSDGEFKVGDRVIDDEGDKGTITTTEGYNLEEGEVYVEYDEKENPTPYPGFLVHTTHLQKIGKVAQQQESDFIEKRKEPKEEVEPEVLLRGIDTPEAAKQYQRKKEYGNSKLEMDELNQGKFKLVRKAQWKKFKVSNSVNVGDEVRLNEGFSYTRNSEQYVQLSYPEKATVIGINDDGTVNVTIKYSGDIVKKVSLDELNRGEWFGDDKTAQTKDEEDEVLTDEDIRGIIEQYEAKKRTEGLSEDEEKELKMYKEVKKEQERYEEGQELTPGEPPIAPKSTLPKRYKKPTEAPEQLKDISEDLDLVSLFTEADKLTKEVTRVDELITNLTEKIQEEEKYEEVKEKLEGVWKEIRKKVGDQPGRAATFKDRVYAIMNQIRRSFHPPYMKIAEQLIEEFGGEVKDLQERMQKRYEILRKTKPKLVKVFTFFTAPTELYRKFKGSLTLESQLTAPTLAEGVDLPAAPVKEEEVMDEGEETKQNLLNELVGYSYDILDVMTGVEDDFTLFDFTLSEIEDRLAETTKTE